MRVPNQIGRVAHFLEGQILSASNIASTGVPVPRYYSVKIMRAMKTLFSLAICFAATLCAQIQEVNTFSIVAFDPATGECGITVASRYFSVGAVVPWAEAGTGCVATQANVNVGYGPRGLELLRQGLNPKQVLAKLQEEDTFDGKDGRQVAIVDAKGNIAAYTGPKAPNWAGDRQGKTWSAQGNILVGPQVPESMGTAFEATEGELAERLFAALKAGDDAGGDSRGKQSASMLIVRKGAGRNTNNDRYIYINVDDNPAPIPELRRLLDLNLAALYQDKTGKLMSSGKTREARDAALTAAKYSPGAYMTVGFLSYTLGEKSAALIAFQKVKQTDPELRKRLEASQRAKAILADSEFMKQLFPEK
jgi:uncharacterized Ntn-hydrolase superfamily protein